MLHRRKVYFDDRDRKFLKPIKRTYEHLENRYRSRRKSKRVYLYNDLNNVIKYIKVCHIIYGKEVVIFEILNLKPRHTFEVDLRNHDVAEDADVYVIYQIDAKRTFSENITTLYNEFYTKHDLLHFQFTKFFKINLFFQYKITPYKTAIFNPIYILWALVLMVALFIVYFIDCSCNNIPINNIYTIYVKFINL